MLDHSWITLFKTHILDRGAGYAANGAVENLKIADDCISADVVGSAKYSVQISLKNNRPVAMSCTCPYAAEGKNCKHMAAVLLTAEVMESTETLRGEGQPAPQSIRDLLMKTEKDDLVDFLAELADGNNAMANRIRTRFSKSISSIEMQQLQAEARAIVRDHENRGFIDYREAMDFEVEMSSFLDKTCADLLDANNFDSAITLSTYVFLLLNEIDIDDDGEIASLARDCCGVWDSILKKCPAATASRLCEWLEDHMADPKLDYLGDVLVDFHDEAFADEETLRSRLAELDRIVDSAAGRSTCPARYSTINNAEPAVLERLKVMRRLGFAEDEIEAYRYAHRSFAEVRDQYLAEARAAGDDAQVLSLLKEGTACTERYDYNAHRYSLQLADLYAKIGDKSAELGERCRDFCLYADHKLADFKRVKEVCPPDAWPQYRDRMLAAVSGGSSRGPVSPFRLGNECLGRLRHPEDLCTLLASEGMTSELYAVIASTGAFEVTQETDSVSAFSLQYSLIDKYGKYLAEDYSADILHWYEWYLQKLVVNARGRKQYDLLLYCLNRMKEYDGGSEAAASLAREWTNRYPTRKVLVSKLTAFAR